jgi:uncharacterized protein
LKLHAQALSNSNTVTGYGPDYIEINRTRHAGSLLLQPDGPVQAWDVPSLDALDVRHLAAVLALQPELVLIGTGARQRFLAPQLGVALAQAGVGFEVMDTAAACRTFNILMAEGRRVVAAFLPWNAAPPVGAGAAQGAVRPGAAS